MVGFTYLLLFRQIDNNRSLASINRLQKRFKRAAIVVWGPNGTRIFTTLSYEVVANLYHNRIVLVNTALDNVG